MTDYTKEFEIAGIMARQELGPLTPEEQAKLDEWLAESDENAALYKKLTQQGTDSVAVGFDTERFEKSTIHKLRNRNRRQIYTRVASAAAVVAIGIFSYLLIGDTGQDGTDDILMTERTYAVMSLPGGRTVDLVAEEGHDSAWKKYADEQGADNEAGDAIDIRIDVPCGSEYKVRLDDGTLVWLNSESSLSYPKTFTGDKRAVKFSGEAYFEVAADAEMPFIVTAKGTEVRVLGTTFNIAAYEIDRAVTTTLVSGSVEVATESGSVTLSPGKQAVVRDGADEIMVTEVDPALYSAWTTGVFKFDKMPLDEICARLSRWYGVDFVFEGGTGNERFTGGTWKYVPLEDFLSKIEQVTDVTFNSDGDKITVTPK